MFMYGEATGLVGGDVAGNLHALHVYQVCSELLNLRGFVVRHDSRWDGGGGCGLGAADIFAEKFEVSFGG